MAKWLRFLRHKATPTAYATAETTWDDEAEAGYILLRPDLDAPGVSKVQVFHKVGPIHVVFDLSKDRELFGIELILDDKVFPFQSKELRAYGRPVQPEMTEAELDAEAEGIERSYRDEDDFGRTVPYAGDQE